MLVVLIAGLGYFILAETRTVYVTKEEIKEQYVSKLELSEKLNIIMNKQTEIAANLKIIADRIRP